MNEIDMLVSKDPCQSKRVLHVGNQQSSFIPGTRPQNGTPIRGDLPIRRKDEGLDACSAQAARQLTLGRSEENWIEASGVQLADQQEQALLSAIKVA
jgi:hypothetical protein